MKDSTHDKAAGTAKEIKGAAKEFAGKVTNNPDLRDRGQAEKIEGKVQKKVGDVEKVFNK